MSQSPATRVVVITGASSGIGLATAKAFAALGWHVIGQGRDAERSAQAAAAIGETAAQGGKVDFLRANLSLMAETRQLAEQIKGLTGRVDVLINNAGGVRDQRYVTSEGTEETFSANHLAPFLLTRELMPLLETAAAANGPGSARVLAVSSMAYLQPQQGLNWDDLQRLQGEFQAGAAYCEVKLANQLFNVELSRRVADRGIVSQALVPGPVATNFFKHGDENMQAYEKTVQALTPEEVAETLVWMATAPETGKDGGRMFYQMAEHAVQPHGKDPAAARRLWDESEILLASMGY
ncbi:SDR family NAD(P)-dependent oxidoreductase [Novosphingobium sp. PS1R-30]|uniref:SDR family NAD(P)-dependent oxidoreductase n=1 Tax=Novosphingobium anseongense TaxID=3133436 RepID=A0ABU8RTK3_9SPHN